MRAPDWICILLLAALPGGLAADPASPGLVTGVPRTRAASLRHVREQVEARLRASGHTGPVGLSAGGQRRILQLVDGRDAAFMGVSTVAMFWSAVFGGSFAYGFWMAHGSLPWRLFAGLGTSAAMLATGSVLALVDHRSRVQNHDVLSFVVLEGVIDGEVRFNRERAARGLPAAVAPAPRGAVRWAERGGDPFDDLRVAAPGEP